MRPRPGTSPATFWAWSTSHWKNTNADGTKTVVDKVVCKASIEAVFDESRQCDDVERCLFGGGRFRQDGRCVPWNETPQNAPDTQVTTSYLPNETAAILPGPIGGLHNIQVATLAGRYGAPAKALAAALSKLPADGATLLEPSPYGQASVMWQEGKLMSIVSVTNRGDVVGWRGAPQALK